MYVIETNHIQYWNQDRLNWREITTKMSPLKNQMENKHLKIMDVSNLTINKDKLITLREETMLFQLRAWTRCVSRSYIYFFSFSFVSIVGYEFTHKPDLFNTTTLGRAAAAQMASGRPASTKGPLATMRVTDEPACVAKNINPTQHWESTYKNVVNTTTEKGRIISRRPTWSINRQAYSSSRGLYLTEFGDSFGNTGDNPRNILPAGATKQFHKNNELSIGTS